MTPERIIPDWPAPQGVRAFVTTRSLGDMAAAAQGRARLRRFLPAEPLWLRQVHGTGVEDAGRIRPPGSEPEADAFVVRERRTVCAIQIADCMPVVLACEKGEVIGLAHAGWRGLAAGVLEATLAAMNVAPQRVIAWLGPAIGPQAYEVGDEVRAAFLECDGAARTAFAPVRPGHWLLDLYAVARQRLARAGVEQVFGGTFCTCSERERFFSFRRDRTRERMAALAWIE